MKTKPYDEHYRRQHRIVGHYLALQAGNQPPRELLCLHSYKFIWRKL